MILSTILGAFYLVVGVFAVIGVIATAFVYRMLNG